MFSRRGSKKLRVDAKRLQIETLEDRIVMSAAPLAAPTFASEPVVETSAALLSTEDWVRSLVYYQFNQLLPEHVQYLTLAQVASIPNASYFAAMSAGVRRGAQCGPGAVAERRERTDQPTDSDAGGLSDDGAGAVAAVLGL